MTEGNEAARIRGHLDVNRSGSKVGVKGEMGRRYAAKGVRDEIEGQGEGKGMKVLAGGPLKCQREWS